MATTSTALPLTPARRAWLAIGVPVCLLLIANTGLSLVGNLGRGSFPVNYTYPSGTATVGLTISGGQVLIKQGAAGRARVEGTAQYSIFRPHVTTRSGRDGAAFGYHCVFPYGTCDLDATLTVPPGQATSASTDGGSARVTGTTGPVSLSTGGGNITADNAAGPLTLHTSGGDVTATGITARQVTASTGGGNIEITFTAVPRDIQVNTAGGEITLILPPGPTAYHVTASTAGGNVTDNSIPQNTASPYVIAATSGGGDITIRLAGQ